jgi:hypothetical protein
MCFYNQTRWICGNWRWGSFQQQCKWEYRLGETCGLKLIFATNHEDQVCNICHQWNKKQRRIAKLTQDVKRWQNEGDRPAGIEKAMNDLNVLQDETKALLKSHRPSELVARSCGNTTAMLF